MNKFGWLSRTSRIFKRYCCLSHWARGDHTAGPREVLSKRNWIPTASVTSPMIPPSASTSRTRWPLAIPPTAGLQDIWAIRSTFSVNRAVFSPMRAAAIAASQPACPAPTTTTSYCSVNFSTVPVFYRVFLKIPNPRSAVREPYFRETHREIQELPKSRRPFGDDRGPSLRSGSQKKHITFVTFLLSERSATVGTEDYPQLSRAGQFLAEICLNGAAMSMA